MPYFDMNFKSDSLNRNTTVSVILPEKPRESYKTLYLLHGLSDDHRAWLIRSGIARYARKYDVAVVMPDAGRSWYADTATGEKYFTLITEELPTLCRGYFAGMSARREDNFIAGLSMGGYGALKAALTYPERYAGCASLSGSLDITRKGRKYLLHEWRGIFGFHLESADELAGGDCDLFELSRRVAARGAEFPDLFLWCGTEDSLLSVNHDFREHLSALGAKFTYRESEGDHSWHWWDLHIQAAMEQFFGSKD